MAVIPAVQCRFQKFPGFFPDRNTSISPPSRALSEGRIAIVTDVERGMRWTRAASGALISQGGLA